VSAKERRTDDGEGAFAKALSKASLPPRKHHRPAWDDPGVMDEPGAMMVRFVRLSSDQQNTTHISALVSGTSRRPFSGASALSQMGKKWVTPVLTMIVSAGRLGRRLKPSTETPLACNQATARISLAREVRTGRSRSQWSLRTGGDRFQGRSRRQIFLSSAMKA
jgi:hypothetical protein